MKAVLALQVPTPGGPITVTMDSRPQILLTFKRGVIARYELALNMAETAVEKALRQRELEYMSDLLDWLIPESGEHGQTDTTD